MLKQRFCACVLIFFEGFAGVCLKGMFRRFVVVSYLRCPFRFFFCFGVLKANPS